MDRPCLFQLSVGKKRGDKAWYGTLCKLRQQVKQKQ